MDQLLVKPPYLTQSMMSLVLNTVVRNIFLEKLVLSLH